MKKCSKKWLVLFLAAVLAFGTIGSGRIVWAETVQEENGAEAGKETEPAGEENPAEGKESGGEENPAEGEEPGGEENPAEEKKPGGKENPAEEAEPAGEENRIGETEPQSITGEKAEPASEPETEGSGSRKEETPAEEEENAYLAYAGFDSGFRKYTVVLQNLSLSKGEEVIIPVWSDEGGQDDLKWNKAAVRADGLLESVFRISDYKHPGLYYADVYRKDKSGKYHYLFGLTFDVPSAASADVTIVKTDRKKGTATIRIENIDSPAGVKSVVVPTWSMSGQKDIHWYSAQEAGDGVYTVTFSIADHEYNWAVYRSHVYVTDKNGFMSKVGQVKPDFSVMVDNTEITYDETSAKCTVRVKFSDNPAGLKSMVVPVWSSAGGQDDLKWIDMAYDKKTDTWKAEFSTGFLKHTGKCYAHIYGKTSSGSQQYVTGGTFEIPKPSAEKIDAVQDSASGSFTVTVSGVSGLNDISEIVIPVWCAKDQSDIKWYHAEKKGGVYRIAGDVSSHKYHVGEYKADVYADSKSKGLQFLGGTTITIQASDGTFVLTDKYAGKSGKEQTVYTGTLTGLLYPGGAASVKAAVWSDTGGQDDLVWYTMTRQSSAKYSFELPVKNHKTAGKYYIDIYVFDKNGKAKFLTGYDGLNIDGVEKSARITAFMTKSDTGAFQVQVYGLSSVSGISSVSVPVWSDAGGQDDIKWYKAARQNDGTWLVSVSPADHKKNTGKYIIHVYMTTGNGQFGAAGTAEYTVKKKKDEIAVPDHFSNEMQTIYVYYPSTEPTSVAVWSKANGQDDLQWYPMVEESDGIWKATFSVLNHKHGGACYAHVYSGDKILAAASFQIDVASAFQAKYLYGNDSAIDYVQCAINIAKNDAIGYGHTWPNTISCAGLVGLTLTYCGYADFIKNDPLDWGYIDLSEPYLETLENELGCTRIEGEIDEDYIPNLLPGDILYYDHGNDNNHIGFYVGNGLTVEARGPSGANDADSNKREVAVYNWSLSPIVFQTVFRIPNEKVHYRG